MIRGQSSAFSSGVAVCAWIYSMTSIDAPATPYTYTRGDELFGRAQQVIPGGVYSHLGPLGGCHIPRTAFPQFASRAEGTRFWDVDGNEFIDYLCGYGPNVLGYGDPEVRAAARAQEALADVVTTPAPIMVEFAELLVDTVASADWAYFAKTGGDVTTLAVMTARAATGRRRIVFFEGYYHGVAPWTQKPGVPGVLDQDVAGNIEVPWNDFEALRAVFTEHRGEIAALIANGYNVSALCGHDSLRDAVSSVFYTGSYWMSAVPFAAGITTLTKLRRIDGPARFRELGTRLTSGLVEVAAASGYTLVTSGEPALFYLRLADDDSPTLHQRWIAECVRRGAFLVSHHNHFVNAALTETDIDRTLDIADDAFAALLDAGA